jgi:uncharacterized protein (DUF362 family)
MSISHHKFGSTTIAKVIDSAELRQILNDPWLESKTIIIKPNWVSSDPAEFTDADTLRMFFDVLDSQIIIVESYCLPRAMNLLKDGMSFSTGNREVNWRWLLKGKGWQWLIENNDWEWFKNNGHWDQLKKEDQAFLDIYGFTDLFKEFDVTYINVTEEVWNGRIAEPSEVKRLVESHFKPVHEEELYNLVPKKLYNLQGSTFISLARLKMYASFTMKNLFGMIPDPLRPWWHGPHNSRIAQSIVDVNKVYHALFNVYGICEAIKKVAYTHPAGPYEGIYSGKYNIVEGQGVIAFGRDLVSLDSLLLSLNDPSTRSVVDIMNRIPITMAQEELGFVDSREIEDAKSMVKDWLSP